jgi:short-subunit dehydrogenase
VSSGGLEGRRVLVTGASAGIGAGLAEEMARRGAIVGLCSRSQGDLDTVLARCRQHVGECRAWPIDLGDTDAIPGFVRQVEEELGELDIVMNNAGIPKRRGVTDLRMDEVSSVAAVNYLAPVALSLAVIPTMLRRGGGRIVNVASVAGRLGSPGEAAYGAAKAALLAWSEASAAELRSRGIVVQVVIPGPVDTRIVDVPGEDPPLAARAGIERLSVDDAVRAILSHLETDRFEVWIPPEFRAGYVAKAADPEGSIQRAADWYRDNVLLEQGS